MRYQSPSPIPESRGICPGLERTTKPVLVVARISSEDPSWLDALREKYHICVYTANAELDPSSNHLQVPANRAHESMPYLTFMIDNYEHIPSSGAVFVHGTRFAWHNDHPEYDNTALLIDLNIPKALGNDGYYNLRCDWSSSTCSPHDNIPQGSFETRSRAVLEPFNQRVVSDAALPGALVEIFGGSETATKVRLRRADAVRSQCCAQFVVSREAIQSHSWEEYVALRQWLLDGMADKSSKRLKGASPADDRIAGRILSYVWHILFLQRGIDETGPNSGLVDLGRLNTLACPTAKECYCRLYGRCDLEDCDKPGRCRGQYKIPPGFKIPEVKHDKSEV